MIRGTILITSIYNLKTQSLIPQLMHGTMTNGVRTPPSVVISRRNIDRCFDLSFILPFSFCVPEVMVIDVQNRELDITLVVVGPTLCSNQETNSTSTVTVSLQVESQKEPAQFKRLSPDAEAHKMLNVHLAPTN
jgi:hypothetical protein